MLLTVVYREACLQTLSWSSRVIENINTTSSLMNHLSRTGVILSSLLIGLKGKITGSLEVWFFYSYQALYVLRL